jgi:long-chain fatty acid transport protein
VGYNVGLLYQPAPDLRFGLDYHSRIQHSLSGSQYIAVPPLLAAASPATAASLAAADSAVRIRYNLPDDIALGVYWQATPQLALMSDVRWTDWSVFRSVGVVPTNPLLPASVTPENFHNAWEISVGANERVFDRLLLQTGVAFDQSPVTNQVRTSAIPDSDRVILSLGAQYDVLPNLTLQLAYAHIFFTAAPIAYAASPTSGVLVGKYSNSADTLSAGAKVKF